MFETMASFMLVEHANGAMFDPPARTRRLPADSGTEPQGRTDTSDGYIAALIYNDKHWNAFVDAVQPAWADDLYSTLEQRAKQIDTVYGLVAETMKERTTEEWLALFRELEIPAAPLNTPDALFDNPHLNAVGLFETVDTPHGPVRFPGVPTWFSRTPGRVAGPAPVLGADTAEVLGELGLDAQTSNLRWNRDRRTVDFEMGQKAAELRGELRELVKDHVPEHFLGAFTDNPADLETAQQFCRTLAERNLLCMAWPEEFGGGGASVWEQTVVREEMWAHHEPRGAQYMGVNWVGPIIMRHGTEEQQRKHLPPIARGEVIWCQGFSEPEAGSDLASLRTPRGATATAGWSAVRRSGRPTPPWRSGASCSPAPRKGEKKQQGLTIFLVPMDDPAIQVQADPLHDGSAPPQRGVLRRPAGHRGRRARHRRRGLVDRAGRDVVRAGRHRPLRPLRAVARRRTGGARRPLGRPARGVAGTLGSHADALPPGPADGVSRRRVCRAAGASSPVTPPRTGSRSPSSTRTARRC